MQQCTPNFIAETVRWRQDLSDPVCVCYIAMDFNHQVVSNAVWSRPDKLS